MKTVRSRQYNEDSATKMAATEAQHSLITEQDQLGEKLRFSQLRREREKLT